jgi:hypothetical protein
MPDKRNEIPTTGLKYPMVDLFTGTVMPIVYLNTIAVSYLLLLTSPWLFTQAWMKELERESTIHNHPRQNRRVGVVGAVGGGRAFRAVTNSARNHHG